MDSERVLSLHEAAVEGNAATLLALLEQDPLILDKFIMNCPSETPLQIATMLGHVDFVKETLRVKPELAKELDSRQSSPLHVASQKGYIDIVRVLLGADLDMCFARDVEGRNPLHLAAIKGRPEILRELIQARPLPARATTNCGESILHLCIKFGQLETLMFLVESIGDSNFLNARDTYGMSIIHLAVATKQIEVVRFLTSKSNIEVNALDANGFTALDILSRSLRDVKDWEIGELLRQAGAISLKDVQLFPNESNIDFKHNQSITSHTNHQDTGKLLANTDDWLERHTKTLMVVASLIATMAFQAGLYPPGGSWQDHTSESDDPHAYSPESPKNHTAGYPIMASYEYMYYTIFFSLITTSFLASLSIILLLISGLPIRRRFFIWILMVIMWIAVAANALAYAISAAYYMMNWPARNYSLVALNFLWILLMGCFVLAHIIRLIMKMINFFRKLWRKQSREILNDL